MPKGQIFFEHFLPTESATKGGVRAILNGKTIGEFWYPEDEHNTVEGWKQELRKDLEQGDIMQQEPTIPKLVLPALILTVGLPRSGKSTWSRKTGFPIVNPDSIRLALYGQPFLREAEPMVWTMTRYMIKSLFLAGHQIVILDGTNYTKKFRDEWYNPHQWTCHFKRFNATAQVCIERAEATGTEYLIPVIEKMSAGFEPLTDFEKKTEIFSMTLFLKKRTEQKEGNGAN
ncbi:MAG TPA: AAA family ATPase [Phormidium sp.]